MISVLIPARNEFLLAKTIESILSASEGEIEVIAVLDGVWDTPRVRDDPRVALIKHNEPVGQRAAVNEAARLAKGKYILKTDGHSTFDKGFDVKLAKNCEYDWTVIPRMYNLHAFDWVCENGHRYYQDKADPYKVNLCPECGKQLKIEMVWKIRKHKRTDFMHINKDLKVKYWGSYGKRPEAKGKIVDIMNGIGACWFQHKDRFWELGGLDEKHGFWGQVGVEIACKAWLSGGRHVVNKNTWFAHVFRTTGSFSFPYKNPGRDQQKAEKYSRDLWLNNKWPLQKRSFGWLIEKFSPVPTWDGQSTPKSGQSAPSEYIVDTMLVDDLWENRIKHTQKQKTKQWLLCIISAFCQNGSG
jgi:glycosyltransferase involved in cell wall biosynthesis